MSFSFCNYNVTKQTVKTLSLLSNKNGPEKERESDSDHELEQEQEPITYNLKTDGELDQGDCDEGVEFLQKITEDSKNITKEFRNLLFDLQQTKVTEGNPILDIRNQMMMVYLESLVDYISLKISGQTVENHPIIDQLIDVSTLLDRVLKLQVRISNDLMNKIHRFSSKPNNPIYFKPSIEDFEAVAPQSNVAELTNTSTTEEAQGEDVFTCRKIKKVEFVDSKKKSELALEKRERALANSTAIQDFKDKYLDTPREVVMTNSLVQQERHSEKIRREFEEENYRRIKVDKQTRHLEEKFRRGQARNDIADEILDFNADRQVFETEGEPRQRLDRKKRKMFKADKKQKFNPKNRTGKKQLKMAIF